MLSFFSLTTICYRRLLLGFIGYFALGAWYNVRLLFNMVDRAFAHSWQPSVQQLVRTFDLLFLPSNVYCSGASGWDLVPHRDFWRDVPYLAKDVVSHLFSSVRGNQRSTRGGYVSV